MSARLWGNNRMSRRSPTGCCGVSVASAVAGAARVWRDRFFGTAMRWSPSGVAFWAYPRVWATAEVRVGAGGVESQV